MSTEGNDLRGRRRLFGSRRRQAEAPEAPPQVPEAAPESANDTTAEEPATPPETTEPTGGSSTQVGEFTPEPSVPAPAPTPDEDNWTVETDSSTEAIAPETAAATSAPILAESPEVPGVPVPADEVPAEDGIKLAPAEGGHVEPPATGHGAGRSRSGSVGLPGASERSQSVSDADSDAEGDDELPTYELPRIIAIANQKGGVGKTTTSVNLGASLAELGYRVLVVDLDPQGNATTGLGINARNLQASVYDVIMTNAAIEDCVEPTSLKNLFVAPATIDLAGAEIELVPAFSRELKLRRALEEVRDEYDYVLIDCPPSLGLLTVNGLAAADDVIVPIQCEYYALEGLSQLIRNVTLVRTNLNPKLDVRGIVLTMYDARTKLADQVEQEVRDHFGRRVYQTVVPRTVRLSEAPSFGQPIIVFDSTSRGAVAYRELAKEVSSGATRRAG